jgi:hypothetical protein
MSLQKPQIIDIKGSALTIKHPNLESYIKVGLSAQTGSGTTISVFDNLGFTNGDHIVIGTIGRPTTETRTINGAVSRGQSLTINSALSFAHKQSEFVTVCPEAKIRIYSGPTNDFSAATLIATVDIQFSKSFTTYFIPNASIDNFYFADFANNAATIFSDPSVPIPASGYNYQAASVIIGSALNSSNSAVNDLITYDFLIGCVQEAQQRITQVQSKDGTKKDWSFEIAEDYLYAIQDQRTYSLAALTKPIKYSQTNETFIEVLFENNPLRPRTRIDIERQGTKANNTVATAQAAVGATTLTVRSTGEFAISGNLAIAGQKITYTGKTDTTFTGIPATGSGSITSIIPSGSEVWITGIAGKPSGYCISQQNIIFDLPFNNTLAGKPIYLRYYSKVSAVDELGDLVAPEFTNLVRQYLVYKIEYAKGNKDQANVEMSLFETMVSGQAMNDIVETAKVERYYTFDDGDYRRERLYSANL